MWALNPTKAAEPSSSKLHTLIFLYKGDSYQYVCCEHYVYQQNPQKNHSTLKAVGSCFECQSPKNRTKRYLTLNYQQQINLATKQSGVQSGNQVHVGCNFDLIWKHSKTLLLKNCFESTYLQFFCVCAQPGPETGWSFSRVSDSSLLNFIQSLSSAVFAWWLHIWVPSNIII